jgi:mono/diheme cytochrome c family protein
MRRWARGRPPAIEKKENAMSNRLTLELFILSIILALGIPVFALLGARDGESLARYAYPREESTPAGPRSYRDAVLASAESAEKGKALFAANCIACHGTACDGRGAAAAGLTPPPRNFLDPKAAWTRSREPADIYQTLTEGSPGTAMAGFSYSLSVEDRWALVHYLGSLPGVEGKYKPVDDAFASAWKPEGPR